MRTMQVRSKDMKFEIAADRVAEQAGTELPS